MSDLEKMLDRVKSARADLEAKQDDVQKARDRYYDAVRALNDSGMSLREVAEKLGLSHQRIHQMIGESADGATKRRRRVRRAAKAGGLSCLIAAAAIGVGSWVDIVTTDHEPEAPNRVASTGLPRSPDGSVGNKSRDVQLSCWYGSKVVGFSAPQTGAKQTMRQLFAYMQRVRSRLDRGLVEVRVDRSSGEIRAIKEC